MTRSNRIHRDPLDQLAERLEGGAQQVLQSCAQRLRWRLRQTSGRLAKRSLDIAASATALILLFPLLGLVALGIKLQDGGPVLFWQERIGKWGQPFRFPKFRSMVVNAEALRAKLMENNQHGEDGVTFKMKRDPRITPIGRIIRRTSIDELPQLWCVFKGDMSLVGPRPALTQEVARYSMDDRARLDAIPGLTCTWQVSGRSEIPFPQQLQMDVDYIESQSAWEDIKLLFRTIPAVLFGRGAY